ncbi:hypothetical protein ACIRS1_07210 [Kitasatospora sp. NPDC101176]|uniref:hypothetical protein n=1 Tax=Kitasatospora sp. NPDC101176 TaxID=3364099 RepID=UPI0038093AD4
MNPEHAPRALLTPQQALHTLDALLDEAMSAIRPALAYRAGRPRSTEQSAPGIDEYSLGYATLTRERHIMTRVAPTRYGALLGVTERGWTAHGHRITAVNPHQPAMFATTAHGHGLALLFGAAGNIAFQATVGPIPVIRDHDPFGPHAPEPTLPNGNPDILPRHDHPFWSA